MKNEIKAFTYWECSPYRPTLPPYIACGLITMQSILGCRFLLLTPSNLQNYIDFDFSTKDFYFAGQSDKEKDSISRITAKSDFIRFKYICDNGGIWMDADTIILKDFFNALDPLLKLNRLVWHSEQFFGGQCGINLVKTAVNNMLESQRQSYGNPGQIKGMLPQKTNEFVTFIPSSYFDPTGDGSYKAAKWEVAAHTGVELNDFLRNKNCRIIKIYNSMLSTKDFSRLSVSDFLETNTLLSKIFLYINSDKYFWIEEAEALSGMLQVKN